MPNLPLFSVAPGDPDTLYVVAERGTSDWGGIWLHKSTDAGRTATAVAGAYVGYPFGTHIWTGVYLAADSRAPSRLFLGPQCWECGDFAGPSLSRSQDDGRTWEELVWGMDYYSAATTKVEPGTSLTRVVPVFHSM